MGTVTISSKYQIVIPKEAREKVHLKKGQRIFVIVKGGIISLVPERSLAQLRGFARGMNFRGLRE